MKVIKNGGTIWGDQFARIVQEHIGESPVFYEIGAFDGRDCDLFKEVLPQSTIVAFEANHWSFHQYMQYKPYQVFNVAVSDQEGIFPFFDKDEKVVSSLLDNGMKGTTSSVATVRLDSFVRKKKLPLPDVVKIDAEGTTYQILQGMGDLLRSVKMLYIETEDKEYWKGQHLHNDVVDLLDGFTCLLMHDNEGQLDSIWLRSQ